jgi:hypothetical protein
LWFLQPKSCIVFNIEFKFIDLNLKQKMLKYYKVLELY